MMYGMYQVALSTFWVQTVPLVPCAARKTGQSVALSVNLPPNEPTMRAFAEKRLMQELQELQLVRGPANAAFASLCCSSLGAHEAG